MAAIVAGCGRVGYRAHGLPLWGIAIRRRRMEHRMKKTWIVVADEAIARLLEVDGRVLKPVEELTDPDAHAKASEMRNDAHGRRGNSITTSAGEAELHQEGQRFAKQVAQRLAQYHHD